MPEQEIVTNDATPSATPADAAQTVTPEPQVNPLEVRLNELSKQLESLQSTIQAKDEVIAGYKNALGTAIQQRQAAPVANDLASKYDPEVIQLIRTESERIADSRFKSQFGTLMVQAQAQQVVGTDTDVIKAAEREFQSLKTNPYYAGQSDEILQALAAATAKSNVQTQRLDAIRAERQKEASSRALQAQAGAGQIPGTAPSNKSAPDNPDADINEYMNDPNTIQAMTKLLGVNPLSDTEISWRGGKKVKAKDAFRDLAVRAVREGVHISERMRTGAGIPIGTKEA